MAAGTGDVLMSRLREGRANTARGAAHFLWETVGRVRYAGARGQLTGAGRQRLTGYRPLGSILGNGLERWRAEYLMSNFSQIICLVL